jgi:hypothetical protein
MFRMSSGFKSLKEVFKKEGTFSGLREIVNSSDVVVRFSEIFPSLEKVAMPISCDKKILKLKVENPAWRNELKFKETELIDKVNIFFNEQRIIQIRFIG